MRRAGRAPLAKRAESLEDPWVGDDSQSPASSPATPPTAPPAAPTRAGPSRLGERLGLLGILLAAAATRWRLLSVPLERDEGEYAYGAQLLLDGQLPYVAFYNMKLPGIYATYAGIFGVFGESVSAIHAGLLIANAAVIGALFWLGRQLSGPIAGLGAAACFAVLSLLQPVQGLFANAEHFVLPWAIAGLCALVHGLDRNDLRWIVGAGLLTGTGFLVKQHGVAFLALGGVWIGLHIARVGLAPGFRLLLAYGAGSVVPYLLTLASYAWAGAADAFWFWTFSYAQAYASRVPFETGLGYLQFSATPILRAAPGIVALAIAGWSVAPLLDRTQRTAWPRLASFAVFSAIAIAPGFLFRPHYFVLVLPAVALAAGMALQAVVHRFPRPAPWPRLAAVGLGVAALAHAVWGQHAYLFTLSPEAVVRTTYGTGNPFAESLGIADFLREHSEPEDRILVLGSEPQLYFYAQRRASTGFMYAYPLMEEHAYAQQMQRDFIAEAESHPPRYVVWIGRGIRNSWLQRQESHKDLFRWYFARRPHWRLVAAMDFRENSARELIAGDALAQHRRVRGEVYIEIYEVPDSMRTRPGSDPSSPRPAGPDSSKRTPESGNAARKSSRQPAQSA
ncbi:MAG: glycosyltransferase family 39 protein [Myxococcota bacterium]